MRLSKVRNQSLCKRKHLSKEMFILLKITPENKLKVVTELLLIPSPCPNTGFQYRTHLERQQLTDDAGHVELNVAFRIFFNDRRNLLFVFRLLLLLMAVMVISFRFGVFRLWSNFGVDRFLAKSFI